MKIKPIILAVALALSATSVFAENKTFDVPLTGPSLNGLYTAGFDVQHVLAGAFEDTITFSPASIGGLLAGSLVTTSANHTDNINFTSGSVNGIAFNFSPIGANEWGFNNIAYSAGPLVLTIFGIAGPTFAVGADVASSYAGTMNISPVPEPETYAMLLAGLGLFGFIALRRRKNTEAAPRQSGNMLAC